MSRRLGPSFNVDDCINRFLPHPRLDRLPRSISWFLGYREQPRQQIGSVLVWFWAFTGAFLGILVVEAVFRTAVLKAHGTPTVIGSFVR